MWEADALLSWRISEGAPNTWKPRGPVTHTPFKNATNLLVCSKAVYLISSFWAPPSPPQKKKNPNQIILKTGKLCICNFKLKLFLFPFSLKNDLKIASLKSRPITFVLSLIAYLLNTHKKIACIYIILHCSCNLMPTSPSRHALACALLSNHAQDCTISLVTAGQELCRLRTILHRQLIIQRGMLLEQCLQGIGQFRGNRCRISPVEPVHLEITSI